MSETAQIKQILAADSINIDHLVSESFGYKKPHHFFQDFPVWASESAKRFGVFRGDALIAHVGMRETQIGRERVGLVGAVATELNHRGEGLSTKLLKHVIEYGTHQSLDWLVLWGSEHGFYSRFGFELSGIQTRVPIDGLIASWGTNAPPKIHEGYHSKIFDWLYANPLNQGIKWNAQDRAWFERHETVKWYWREDPFAFVGFERGMDLPHLVHEMGGSLDSIPSLLKRVHHQDPNAELLIHPSFFASLKISPQIPHTHEHLCLSKPLKGQEAWPDHYWISGLNAC